MEGMPRRYADYVPEYQSMHRMATMGSWIMVAGILLMMGHLLYSIFKGKKAEDDPWGGATLEWTTQTPPPLLNFVEPPVMTRGAYEYPDEVEK